MAHIPVEFLHTDSDAHLSPPGHQWAPVRRYRTRSFVFPLAIDERRLLHASAHLAPVAGRVRRLVGARLALPMSVVALAFAVVILYAPTSFTPLARVALGVMAGVGIACVAWGLVTRALRREGLVDGELLVLTHHRVLRFAPTAWRWRDSMPGSESPYEVTEISHEAIAGIRASTPHGFDGSGVLEIFTFRGERVVFVHVPDAANLADRIRTVATAYAERGLAPAQPPTMRRALALAV